MTSFLERLFRYRATESRSPQEDFFTEALGGVLEASRELATAFAGWLACRDFKTATVATQMAAGGNRLDMLVEALDEGHRRHLIVIENKLGAGEGHNQLQRYHDYLEAQQAESRTLVYMTLHERSDFEPSSDAVRFRSRCWFELYDWLDSLLLGSGAQGGRVETLIRELLDLMEAWNMKMALGAHDLASAVAYKGAVQQQLLQILNMVWEECRAGCVSGQWKYDRDNVMYQSAYVLDDLYYEFGFDFARDDEAWHAPRLQLPSAYFAIRGGDASARDWTGMSGWDAPPASWSWPEHERVRQIAALELKGTSFHSGYLEFFLSALEQAKAAIGK